MLYPRCAKIAVAARRERSRGALDKRLYWDQKSNHVFLGRGSFTPRGDVWLAGRGERGILADAISSSFGVEHGVAERVAVEPVLFHRIPAPLGEYAVEVRAHGLRLGALELDPRSGEWLLHASGALASLLESLGVATHRVEARGRLKGSKIRLPTCSGPQLALIRSGDYVGVARRVEECTYKVRDMAPRGFQPLESVAPGGLAGANRAYLERLAREAMGFLRLHALPRGRVYVAVSGGLDSSVSAHLAVESLGSRRVELVYADTGMEFPESIETVEKLASMLGVDLSIVESKWDPLVEIQRRGLMSRDNRWCTRLLKLEGLRRFYERRGARVVVEGTRAWESSLRASLPRRGVNPLIPGVTRLLPILYWARLEVQLYAVLHGIPVNPLYELGFTRIGCMVCPAMNLHELRLASSLYPSFYRAVAHAIEPPGVAGGLEFLLGGAWRRASRD